MDILKKIVRQVKKTVRSNYYQIKDKQLARRDYNGGLIAEIKPSSPLTGKLFSGSIKKIAKIYEKNGAKAISVLTEPVFFKGKLENITIVKRTTQLPVLMKDFIISKKQILAGKRAGADIVLIICGVSPLNLINYAHKLGLKVLLEVNNKSEFKKAKKTNTDFIGINNRNLKTMTIDLKRTIQILEKEKIDRIIIAESGIRNKKDVQLVKKAGARGILVGSAILKATPMEKKVRELNF